MTRSLLLSLGLFLLALAPAGCNFSDSCEAGADSLECYCIDNPDNCANEPDSITGSTPETLLNDSDALPAR